MTFNLKRRSALIGGLSLLFTPAIVRGSSLMKVKQPAFTGLKHGDINFSDPLYGKLYFNEQDSTMFEFTPTGFLEVNYDVICDKSNNTKETIDQGFLNVTFKPKLTII